SESFTPAAAGRYCGSSQIHDRGNVPIFVVCSESETLANLPVRQPDTATFRYWEVAGAAHCAARDREREEIDRHDGIPVEAGPESANTVEWGFVQSAALEHLVRGARGGRPPPSMPPIEVTGTGSSAKIRRDDAGNALGGLRLPDLVAPTASHRGTNAEMT